MANGPRCALRDPSYRCPRSTVRAKFPWLTLEDEIALTPLVRREGVRRGFMTPSGRYREDLARRKNSRKAL
jgi:hypothetical protein